MKKYIINFNDAGQRVDKFIQKAAPSLPQSMMYKGIRTKNIKLNRKRWSCICPMNFSAVMKRSMSSLKHLRISPWCMRTKISC